MSIIYHHTDVNGLMGIINHKNLWATNINFLNDYNEYKIGINSLKIICENYINSKHAETYKDIEPLYKKFLQILNNSMKDNLDNRNHYVVSFTKSRDNLRQWMSYGASNASYAIGFNQEKLNAIKLGKNSIASEHLAYCLHDVAYSMKEIEEKLSIDSISINIIKNLDQLNVYAMQLINELIFELCSLKDSTFSDENEIRMVLQDRKIGIFYEKIQYRSQAGVITPYIEVPITLDAIDEIIIGPNIHNELAQNGLENLLKFNGIKCDIKHTQCSLRQFK